MKRTPLKRKTPLKRGSRLNQVSDRQRERKKAYKIVREDYLFHNLRCERCIKSFASDIHHKKGRIGDNLFDHTTFMAVCRPCHAYIEAHPAEAKAKGWMRPR